MKSEVTVQGNAVQITRVFDAPRDVVFGYWTQAEKLEKWSGCKEATKCEIQMDFRVGGSFTQKMHIAGAGDFSITGEYDEIIEPKRIAYHANIGSAVTRVQIEFFELGNQTKVVLTHEGLPEEFRKFVAQGTTEALDKLDEALLSRAAGISA